MSVDIVPPEERTCEKCGRTDVWDEAAQKWVVVEDDAGRRTGNRHCIHEWDINGEYNPVSDASDGA